MNAPKQPASQRAEESVIGALLRSEEARNTIFGQGLDSAHFYFAPYRAVFDCIVERYYGDDPIDPLTIGELIGPRVAAGWKITEREAVDKVVALAKHDPEDTITTGEHAKVIKRHADYRSLLSLVSDKLNDILEENEEPDVIAGELSAVATRIVAGALVGNETLSYADLGRRWTQQKQQEIAARAQGIELGAHFGIPGIDKYLKGLRATELAIMGGDPGVGKSALAWVMARNFAIRQMRKPEDRRIGTLIWSAEMGEEPSSNRLAQAAAKTDGERLRTGSLTQLELREIAQKWADERGLPIWVNHSGELRETQLRAIVVDAIRRHNVGVLFIDHFKFIKTDEKFRDKNDADEQIVKFLKSTLAKELNLAVICLAHTTKGEETKRRPVMDDLRGSKMISAFADFVMFPYHPWKHASQEKRERGLVAREEFEIIFDKARQAAPGTGEIWMDLSTMTIT